MNVYDFDKTIYDGDSTLDFYIYCLIHNPSIVFCLPKQIKAFIVYKFGKIDKTSFKEAFYCFFSKMHDIEHIVSVFWDKKEYKIKKWYIDQHKETDVVISASPYFLLKEICERIGIKYLIASNVSPLTGKYSGTNCYGDEKVRRFNEEVGREVDCFYTDSKSDLPMMKMAKKAFLVKKHKIVRWSGEQA